jgi:hypothetical protein
MKPTGDADLDRRHQDELNKEFARLQRNRDRRLAREKMKNRKGASQQPEEAAGSPSAEPKPSIEKTGTTRKCANCGQAGHIKTNKKYYCSAHVPPLKPRGRKPAPKKAPFEDSTFQPRYETQNKTNPQREPKTMTDAAVVIEEFHETEASIPEQQEAEESEEE